MGQLAVLTGTRDRRSEYEVGAGVAPGGGRQGHGGAERMTRATATETLDTQVARVLSQHTHTRISLTVIITSLQ